MTEMIICGAGRVGFNLARYLSRYNHTITVIDSDPDLISHINERLEVKAICGHASAPEVLRQAGAETAQMIIAVTQSDEINMVTCEVAHALFGIETKIARLRNKSYLDPRWSKLFGTSHLTIDFIISPEYEVAKSLLRTLSVPGALEVVPLMEDYLQLVAVRCSKDTPLINTPIKQLTQLFPNLEIGVVGIMRDDRQWIPDENDLFLEGDKVYFVAASQKIDDVMLAFGYEELRTSKALILGGGNIGLRLAQMLEEMPGGPQVTVIEKSEMRAAYVAEVLGDSIVLCGDALDKEVLTEADISSAQMVLAVTEDDRVNGLAALLAKRLGGSRSLALINAGSFEPLVSSLGVDAVVNPRKVTVSKILEYINRHHLRAIYSLGTQWGEVVELEIFESSALVGLQCAEVAVRGTLKIVAVLRSETLYIQTQHLTLQTGDVLVLVASPQGRSKIEKFFPQHTVAH
ncbi:MAG: Trk system potassium transporter TrkA [Proteobacteria bacterium]|nr:Trk system potassium transporter TrkA [Pseudomonadota bacterium]